MMPPRLRNKCRSDRHANATCPTTLHDSPPANTTPETRPKVNPKRSSLGLDVALRCATMRAAEAATLLAIARCTHVVCPPRSGQLASSEVAPPAIGFAIPHGQAAPQGKECTLTTLAPRPESRRCALWANTQEPPATHDVVSGSPPKPHIGGGGIIK